MTKRAPSRTEEAYTHRIERPFDANKVTSGSTANHRTVQKAIAVNSKSTQASQGSCVLCPRNSQDHQLMLYPSAALQDATPRTGTQDPRLTLHSIAASQDLSLKPGGADTHRVATELRIASPELTCIGIQERRTTRLCYILVLHCKTRPPGLARKTRV